MKWKKGLICAMVVILALTSLAGCKSEKGSSSGSSSTASNVSGTDESDIVGTDSDNLSSDTATSAEAATSGSGQTSSTGGSGQSGSTKPQSSAAVKPPTASSTNSFNKKDKKVFKEEKTDLKGITIKIASPWNEWVQTDGCPPQQVAAAKALQEIAKDYNCKIEMVKVTNPGKMAEDIATNFASGKIYADIIETQDQPIGMYSYMEDVKKVKSLGLQTNDWDSFLGDSATFKGVQYGVGFMMTQNTAISQAVMVFNRALAEQYGIGDLYQKVRDGKWDYSAFEAASKTISQKTGGKTKGLLQQISTTMNDLIFTNNVTLIGKDNSGYYFKHNDSNLLSALNFWSDYCKNGYMYEHNSEDYGASAAKLFMQRKALFMMTDYIGTSTWFNASMEDTYGVLPLPKGPNAKNYTTVANTKYFMLTKDNPNIEAAGKILVAMANRTGWDMKEWDTAQLETALRDEESLEMMNKYILPAPAISPYKARTGLTTSFTTAIYEIIHENKSAAQKLQEIRGAQNASILEVYK